MPGFFSRNIHLATKSLNCFNSGSRESSLSNSSRTTTPGLSWSTDSGGTTSSTESTTPNHMKVNKKLTSSSNQYRQLRRLCKDEDLTIMAQQQQPQYLNRHVTDTSQTRRSIVAEPGDDWGYFVDFRSPEQYELKRKSFVGERLPPHPE